MTGTDPARWSDFDYFAPPITTWVTPPEPEPSEAEPVEPSEAEPVPSETSEPGGSEPDAPVSETAVAEVDEPAVAEPLADEPAVDEPEADVPDEAETELPALRKVRPRRDPISRPKLAILLSGGFVVFLIVLNLAVLTFHVVRARNQINHARQTLQSARASISAGDLTKALSQVSGMHAETEAASASTSGAVWHFDEHLPLIGTSLTSAGSLARSVNDIAADALPGLTRSITNLKGGRLREPDGSINLALIQQTAGSLATTTAVLTRARGEVAALPAHPLIGAVGNARTQLLGQIDGLLTDLNGASEAAKLAPGMLGINGPRKYFLALENPAESRGAGGLIGAYGIVVVDQGKFTLETVGVDDDFPRFLTPVIDVSPEFTDRWRPFYADEDIRDATASPHFPWDAEAISQLWYRFKDEKVDGVIAIDPAAAGSLIQPGNPLRLSDGTTLTAKQLPTYVEQTLYAKFPTDSVGRKLELEDIERGLFTNLQSAANPESLLRALGHAAGARDLLLASNNAAEESVLAGTPLGGAMPDTPGPFVGVAIHNAMANKMDAYLERTVTWTAGACPTGTAPRTFTTTLKLHNDTPSTPLSPEVGGSNAVGLGTLPSGSNRSWVSVYGAVGSIPTKATLDGQTVDVRPGTERSHPVIGVYIDLAPGQTRTLVVTWSDPPVVDSGGHPIAQTAQPPFLQPLVIPAKVVTSVPNCPV